MRGSLRLLMTTICRSGEYHLSVVITIGFWLPMAPAGIVRAYRVPSACTPLMVCVPRDVVTRSVFPPRLWDRLKRWHPGSPDAGPFDGGSRHLLARSYVRFEDVARAGHGSLTKTTCDGSRLTRPKARSREASCRGVCGPGYRARTSPWRCAESGCRRLASGSSPWKKSR